MEDWDADCIDVNPSYVTNTPQPVINSHCELSMNLNNVLKLNVNETISEELNSNTVEESTDQGNKEKNESPRQRTYTMVADSKNKIFVSNVSFKVRTNEI